MADPTPGDDTGVGPGREYPGIPRWVKVSGIIVIVLVLLIVIALVTGLGGPHGPGRHAPSGGSGIEPVPTFMYSSGGLDNHTPPDGPDTGHGDLQP